MDKSVTQPNIIGIIPARFASQRLAAKALADVAGVPLVIRVWQNVSTSTLLSQVVIATDDERIASVCEQYGAEFVLTSPSLTSGTDRIFAAYQKICGDVSCSNDNTSSSAGSPSIVVNIQGDEPLISGSHIDILLRKFVSSSCEVGTLISKIDNVADLISPACVKVVLAADGTAMYFSRSPIPYFRDAAAGSWLDNVTYWKHIGVYAFKAAALAKFVSLPQSPYELAEKLEQLRLLEQGAKFLCAEISGTFIGVDTAEDLAAVREILS